MSLSAAKSRLRFARENLESGRTDGLASMLDDAEGFLAGEADEEAAPYRAEIAAIRAEVAALPTSEESLSISGARGKLRQATNWLESRYPIDDVAGLIVRAEEFLADVSDVHRDPVLAEIAAFRAQHLPTAVVPADPAPVAAAAGAPVAVPSSPPTDEEDSRRRRASAALRWARERRDPRDLSQVEEAERLLGEVRDEYKTEQVAEIAAIRAEVAAMPSSDEADAINAARYKLKQAVGWLESGYPVDEVAQHAGKAEQDLRYVAEVHRAPLLAEIAAFRAQHLGGAGAAAQPFTAAPTPPAPTTEPTEEEQNMIRRVRTVLMWARDGHDENRIEEAERLLADVREEHRAQYLPEIAEIRALITESRLAEKIRSATQFVDARFGPAERGEPDSIAYCFGRLGSEELRSVLPPAMMEQYQARLSTAIDNRIVGLRNNALERSEPLLRAIEQHLVPNLFAGLSEGDTFAIVGECENLKSRVEHELWAATTLSGHDDIWGEERDPVSAEDKRALNARLVVPQDDPALGGIRGRLAAADATIAAALAVWRKARLDAEVAQSWSITRQQFAGWREETVPEQRRPLEPASLPLTYLAIVRTRSLLDEPRTIEVRRENAGDPVIEAVYREAEQELAAALAKADAVFHAVLDGIERIELPLGESGLDKLAITQDSAAGGLISDAERSLAGSQYLQPYAARVRRINERWQAEIAAAIQARQDLYDQLTAEADAAWPGIVAATGATTEFDATDTGAAGRVVLLHQVYNRAGWEFNGCDFAVRWDGTPVGGGYADHVLKALEHAWYELKLDVNDRVRWDVIGVVEGPGKIGERTNRVLRDAATGQELGKVEEWPPVECTWLRIIALHAGPVAVGPQR